MPRAVREESVTEKAQIKLTESYPVHYFTENINDGLTHGVGFSKRIPLLLPQRRKHHMKALIDTGIYLRKPSAYVFWWHARHSPIQPSGINGQSVRWDVTGIADMKGHLQAICNVLRFHTADIEPSTLLDFKVLSKVPPLAIGEGGVYPSGDKGGESGDSGYPTPKKLFLCAAGTILVGSSVGVYKAVDFVGKWCDVKATWFWLGCFSVGIASALCLVWMVAF